MPDPISLDVLRSGPSPTEGRPLVRPDEIAGPPGVGEIEALGRGALLARYREGVQKFDTRLLSLPEAFLDRPFDTRAGAGLWPLRVVVGHVADGEIALTHRMRRVVAEDHPILQGWDETAFVDARLYADPERDVAQPVAAFIGVIHTLRTFTHEWLAMLPDHAWARSGLHQNYGEQTLTRLVAVACWHLEHHAAVAARKLAIIDMVLATEPGPPRDAQS